jgi:hypothetical protein
MNDDVKDRGLTHEEMMEKVRERLKIRETAFPGKSILLGFPEPSS